MGDLEGIRVAASIDHIRDVLRNHLTIDTSETVGQSIYSDSNSPVVTAAYLKVRLDADDASAKARKGLQAPQRIKIPPATWSSSDPTSESMIIKTMESPSILFTAAFSRDGEYKVFRRRGLVSAGETIRCLSSYDEDPLFYWVSADS